MYARPSPDGRMPRNVRIPRNYSGNAFRQESEETSAPVETREEDSSLSKPLPSESTAPQPQERAAEPPPPTEEAARAGKLFPSPGFKLDLGRLFGRERGGGIGFEELLILGLILLVSQSDTHDDLAFLLLLLLFIP